MRTSASDPTPRDQCRERLLEEPTNLRSDWIHVGFQREVPGVQENDTGFGNVSPEGLGTRWDEEQIIIAAPDREQFRLSFTEEGLVERISLDVLAKARHPRGNRSPPRSRPESPRRSLRPAASG